MDQLMNQAKDMIAAFKGPHYAFGAGILDRVGTLTAQVGKRGLDSWPAGASAGQSAGFALASARLGSSGCFPER